MFIKVRNKNGISNLNSPVECSSIRLRDELKAYYVNKKKELTPLVRAKNISLRQTTRPSEDKAQVEDRLRQPFAFDKHKLEGLIKEEINILKKNAECLKKSISKFSLNKDLGDQAMKECLNSYAFAQRSRRLTQYNTDNFTFVHNFQKTNSKKPKLKMLLSNEESITKILKRISTRKKINRVRIFSRLQTESVTQKSINPQKKQKSEANMKQYQVRSNSRSTLQKNKSEIKPTIDKNHSNIAISKLQLNKLNMKMLSSLSQLSPWKQDVNEEYPILTPMRQWNS